ncbi:MAG: crotonase/enoyl-CoA hydratase family protein [Pseudomonadota bacterium]
MAKQNPEHVVLYATQGTIATITLNRPEKFNTLRQDMLAALDDALTKANRDPAIKVIVLEGAGDAFCGGFDFGGDGYGSMAQDQRDPGMDMLFVSSSYTSYMTTFMGLWRGLKPTIAKVHGYCVGGGSELALCADLVLASECARFGTPYSRVWGCHLSGMWIQRLGLAKAKYYALTGEWISGADAAAIELINFAYPLEQLDDEVDQLAQRLASIPMTQLAAMKLIVNQSYDNQGLQTTQTLGPILDGIMRFTPEGVAFVDEARSQGVRSVIEKRDGPFGDYSQAPKAEQPRRRSELPS